MRGLWKVAVAVPIAFGLYIGFLALTWMPLTLPSEHVGREVFQAFEEDLIDWNAANEHGWWQFWVRPGSDRNPEELCGELHAAMIEGFSWAIPGIGVAVHEWVAPATGGPLLAYCGNPDFLGRDPRGE